LTYAHCVQDLAIEVEFSKRTPEELSSPDPEITHWEDLSLLDRAPVSYYSWWAIRLKPFQNHKDP
jgi:hypothetical protein